MANIPGAVSWLMGINVAEAPSLSAAGNHNAAMDGIDDEQLISESKGTMLLTAPLISEKGKFTSACMAEAVLLPSEDVMGSIGSSLNSLVHM